MRATVTALIAILLAGLAAPVIETAGDQAGEGSRVRIAGIANKNKLALPRKIRALAEDLVRLTSEGKE